MIAVPAALFYVALVALVVFAVLGAIAIVLAIGLFIQMRYFTNALQETFDRVQEKFSSTRDIFLAFTGL